MAQLALPGVRQPIRSFSWMGAVFSHSALVALGLVLALGGGLSIAGITNALSNWDTHWYLLVAAHGYPSQLAPQWAYLPLYPLLVAVPMFLGVPALVAGLAVSVIAVAVVALLLPRLSADEVGAEGAGWAPWLLLLSPFGFFFAAAYTEALFFALVIAAMLCARRGRFGWACMLAALATATRLGGAALLPALLLELAQQCDWSWARMRGRLLPFLLVPAAGLCLLLVAWLVTGDPLAMVHSESRFFGISLDWPWAGFLTTWGSAIGGSAVQRAAFQPEVVSGLLGLPLVLLAAWRLRPLYSVFMGLSWLLAISLDFWRSVPRYEFAFFPLIFLVVEASRGRRAWVRWLLLLAGAASMTYGTTVFARGLWLS